MSSAPSHPVVTSGSQPVSHANASSSMFGDQHTTESETVVGTPLLPQASVACLAVERSMEVMRPVRADGCVSEGIETSHLHCENPGSSVRVDGLGSIDVECPVSGDGFLTDPEFPHALTPTASSTEPTFAHHNDTHTAADTSEHGTSLSTSPPWRPTACSASITHATPPRTVHGPPATLNPVSPTEKRVRAVYKRESKSKKVASTVMDARGREGSSTSAPEVARESVLSEPTDAVVTSLLSEVKTCRKWWKVP